MCGSLGELEYGNVDGLMYFSFEVVLWRLMYLRLTRLLHSGPIGVEV